MAKVSVIIPVYNGERTIHETLISVMKQNYNDLEIIVINDGSTDRTQEIVESLAKQDQRIAVFTYSNAGLSASRNRGVLRASGELISFIDADDIWTEEKISEQVRALQLNPSAKVAYSFVDWIDNQGNFLRHGSHIAANGIILEKLLLRNFIDNGSNVLMYRDVFDQHGYFDETLNSAEDLDLWLRIAIDCEFICIPKAHIFYRISSGSMSAKIIEHSKAVLSVVDAFFQTHPNVKAKLGTECIADKYRYFTFKALEGVPGQQNGWLALNYFLKSIQAQPGWWSKRLKVLGVTIFKLLISILVPKRIRQNLFREAG